MAAKKTYVRRSSVNAFTLIEVLVASVVMVILVGIVAYIAGTVMDSWNRSSGKLSANSEGRFALEMIAQDLETAVLRNNGMQWLRVEEPTSLNNNPPFPSNSVVLKLFAHTANQQGSEGISAIAYKLEYKESYPSGPRSYALYRMVVSPQDTFTNYLSSRFEDPTASSTVQRSLTGAIWDDATISGNENYLVGNVVEFKVLIYDSNTTSSLPRNGTVNYSVTDDYIFGGADSNAGSDLPIYADIILTVVTDEGAEKLKTRDIGGSLTRVIDLIPEDGDDVVAQEGETLIRRVYFKTSPI